MSTSPVSATPAITEPEFTENGRKIFDLRYPRKDEWGNPAESPLETMWRVAQNVAIVNTLYGEASEKWEYRDEEAYPLRSAARAHRWLVENSLIEAMPLSAYYDEEQWLPVALQYLSLLSSLKFLPNSPTWTGAGTPLGNLSACFVLPVADDLGRSRDSIFETMKVAALIQQTGGGNGFDFSSLRPKGALISQSMGKSCGPVGFMKAYDASFRTLQQGGSRRGANMGVLRVDHPDLFEFLDVKTVEGALDQFNISVAITDEFMRAVEKDGDFDLQFDGKVYETVKAKDVWDRLMESAWKLGDPGVIFIDRMNRDATSPKHYSIASVNPCGEQPLPPYGSCNLGSIALNRFVVEGQFDWDDFRKTVHLSVQFLDDVIDANGFVKGVPELAEQAMNERRIGLGVMGLADALMMLGLGYDSTDGQEFVDRLMDTLRYEAMMASIERARDRGPFPWIKDSIYDPKYLKKHGEGAEVDGVTLWKRPASIMGNASTNDWDLLYKALSKWGIRNATTLTIAPTGTISNVSGCEGGSIEPMFSLNYVRIVMQEAENIELPYLSKLFYDNLSLDSSLDVNEVLDAVVANNGSCQGIDAVPQHVQDVFKVAADISTEDHVLMQAICQAYVDSAISKTINAPNSATVEDVGRIYLQAFLEGCKGVTVYRQGSRSLEVLSTANNDPVETTVIDENHWPKLAPVSLPSYVATEGLPTRTFEIETAFGTMQVYVTELRDHPGRPYDVRLQVGKAGNDKTADVEAIGRMASVALRSGVSVEILVDQLEGIGGQSVYGFGPRRVRSAGDGVGKLLRRLYLGEEETPVA